MKTKMRNRYARVKKARMLSLMLIVVMACTLLAGCTDKKGGTDDKLVVRVGAMSGPTAMGMVKLMKDAEDGKYKQIYEFADLSTDPSTFVAPLTKGEIDIAAVPSNLASVIYNNTDGGVQVIAVNTLGVLNIVERGETIQKITDLKGKKLYATGQGATPEYALRHILKENGIDPDKDINIQWCADTTEALSYVSADESAIAMLPQPFATAAMNQVEGLRIALDLNDAWAEVESDSDIITGVVVARTEFIESYPDAVDTFLKDYEDSLNYTNENVAEAAELIASYGIVAKAKIAEKAIPGCHLTFLKGQEMKSRVSGYLQILFDENPASVGGSLPEDDFYYGL